MRFIQFSVQLRHVFNYVYSTNNIFVSTNVQLLFALVAYMNAFFIFFFISFHFILFAFPSLSIDMYSSIMFINSVSILLSIRIINICKTLNASSTYYILKCGSILYYGEKHLISLCESTCRLFLTIVCVPQQLLSYGSYAKTYENSDTKKTLINCEC